MRLSFLLNVLQGISKKALLASLATLAIFISLIQPVSLLADSGGWFHVDVVFIDVPVLKLPVTLTCTDAYIDVPERTWSMEFPARFILADIGESNRCTAIAGPLPPLYVIENRDCASVVSGPGSSSRCTIIITSTLVGYTNASEPNIGGQFVINLVPSDEFGPFDEDLVTIFLSLSGSATSGEDYFGLPEVITIPTIDPATILGFSVIDDELIEGTETVILTYSYIFQGDMHITEEATVYIYDDDEEEPQFTINPGLNDAWFDPAIADQGFFITVYPDDNRMFVSWFTYELPTIEETEGPSAFGDKTQRWLTALGGYVGNVAELNIFQNSRGTFGSKRTQTRHHGTMTVNFTDCEKGLITYKVYTDEFQESEENTVLVEGSSQIVRISDDNVPLCEALDEQLREGG